MSVQLHLTIRAGWADCTLTVDGEARTVTASYLSDGLGDLASTVPGLLRGGQESTVVFQEEPGAYTWKLTHEPPDLLRVRITASPGLAADPREGITTVVDRAVRFRTFAGQLLSAFEQLFAEYGSDGYEERWGYRYPAERIAEIRALLRGAQ